MNTTYAPLVSGSCYEYGDLLLEAGWMAEMGTWLLVILDEDANYLKEQQGRLVAFRLRLDATDLWDELVFVLAPHKWPQWHYFAVDCRRIDPAQLEIIANSRSELLAKYALEREIFRELLSPLWEK
jgi:hypothetical protein